MSTNEIIVANNVYKTYQSKDVKVEALKGVSLSVNQGEIVTVMGPSGCGKTTLLNCLSGLDEIDSGEIIIRGSDITQMTDNQLTNFRGKNMGFVFQAYNLLPVLTARENVELPLVLAGTSQSKAKNIAEERLDLVGLPDRYTHLPTELSGGEQQRVAIARAFANDPAIIWADELTGNLDSKTQDEVIDLIRKMNKDNNQTFIIVTHSDEVGSIGHRTIRMRDGLIEDDGK